MAKQASSSSEGDDKYATMEERKRKRMISNRNSARRSRMRREQHLKDLNCQMTFLKNTSSEIVQKVNSIEQQFMAVELENQILMTQRDELTKRLESLEILSSYVCEYSRDFPQNNLQPWQQLPHQPAPLMASVGMFQF